MWPKRDIRSFSKVRSRCQENFIFIYSFIFLSRKLKIKCDVIAVLLW